MRKDPLDPIDGGTKVKLAMRRVFRPAEAKVSRVLGSGAAMWFNSWCLTVGCACCLCSCFL